MTGYSDCKSEVIAKVLGKIDFMYKAILGAVQLTITKSITEYILKRKAKVKLKAN